MIGEATFKVGDAFELSEGLIRERTLYDLIVSSPPFLALRSYLPADHPLKAKEMGSEPTPAEYLDSLLALVARLAESLAPYGSLVFELGDTYAGSGGGGGDYSASGLRAGQPVFDGSGKRVRETRREGYIVNGVQPPTRRDISDGWPPEKSLTGIPTLFAWSLAYGRNLLTGETSPAGQWRIRNLIPWARPNPPVGSLGDKWRPATSYVVVATRARDRWFDLDAVRTPLRRPEFAKYEPITNRVGPGRAEDGAKRSSRGNVAAGAPPLDWFLDDEQYADQPEPKWSVDDGMWVINTRGFSGAHYATWPPELVRRLILSMCPREVCVECGEPRRRVTGAPSYVSNGRTVAPHVWQSGIADSSGAHTKKQDGDTTRVSSTLGWTHCACGDGCRPTTWRVDTVEVEQAKVDGSWVDVDPADEPDEDTLRRTKTKRKRVVDDVGECADPSHFRRGRVLDPFVGSGTSLLVAVQNGRDATGWDLDSRNVALARERLARLPLTVEGEPPEPEWAEGSLFAEGSAAPPVVDNPGLDNPGLDNPRFRPGYLRNDRPNRQPQEQPKGSKAS